MGSGEALPRRLGDASRDGGEPSRDISFFSRGAYIEPPWFGPATRVRTYFSGESFEVGIGPTFAMFSLWVTEEGLDALIGDLLAAKVQAEIARESA